MFIVSVKHKIYDMFLYNIKSVWYKKKLSSIHYAILWDGILIWS